jgi:hypothetical protein
MLFLSIYHQQESAAPPTLTAEKEIVERDAIWIPDANGEAPTLKACTIDRAVDKLVLESRAPDQQQFLSTFILTYRSFSTPEKVFEMIAKRCGARLRRARRHIFGSLIALRRFDIPSAPSDTLSESDQQKRTQQSRLRVCIVLRYWLANCFGDFADEKLLSKVSEFIEYRITPILASSATSLLQIIEKKRNSMRDPPSTRPEAMPRAMMSAQQWNPKMITSMPSLEVARQLTLIGAGGEMRFLFCCLFHFCFSSHTLISFFRSQSTRSTARFGRRSSSSRDG